MTEKEMIIYIAGLLEGEGCFDTYDNGSGRLYARVILKMTDKDIIEKYASYVEQLTNRTTPKKIYECVQKVENHKTQYAYYLQGSAAFTIMNKLKPFMGVRRSNKIDELLSILGKQNSVSPQSVI